MSGINPIDNPFSIVSSGDDLLTVVGNTQVLSLSEVHSLAAQLAKFDWLEVVPGMTEVSVRFDLAQERPSQAALRLRQTIRVDDLAAQTTSSYAVVDLPICYRDHFAPDMPTIARQLSLSVDQIIERHCSTCLTVQLTGFLPGFAYCGDNPKSLYVPRRSSPRERVAAGSVGIARHQTGIYALASPGGWPIIGRTPLSLFDADAAEPFLLLPGRRIQCRAISVDEFEQLAGSGA